ncbi:MAG TPA: sigma-70 family RNA polymerase sigma factor [Gemmatimonadaceae bacterium]|jgi:RNA polymerase sigma factor (sigma-70 family)|nr:sigma-70 family RNA polymerase sigma factor [Gemmatimonadaceae bacterium]
MDSDELYITGVHHGDEAVFTRLVHAYLAPLTRFAFGFIGVEDTAHDIVQDVFARIWQLGADWSPKSGVAAYLFTAVRHRSLDVIKAGRASHRLQDALLTQTELTSTDTNPYTDVALIALVRRELQTLTQRQRDALRLRYEQEHTMAQVATILGIDVSAAEKLVARALVALRTKLEHLREELE